MAGRTGQAIPGGDGSTGRNSHSLGGEVGTFGFYKSDPNGKGETVSDDKVPVVDR
jgi:hypothetical protein